METYITADTHFGDAGNDEMLDARPFDTYQGMEETLITNWNQTVTEDDRVYVVGDMFGGDVSIDYMTSIMGRLNGDITLVRGNHDPENITGVLTEDAVHQHHAAINTGDQLFYLIHDPEDRHGGRYDVLTYGHVHDVPEQYPFFDPAGKQFNMATDRTEYTPVALDELHTYLERYESFDDPVSTRDLSGDIGPAYMTQSSPSEDTGAL